MFFSFGFPFRFAFIIIFEQDMKATGPGGINIPILSSISSMSDASFTTTITTGVGKSFESVKRGIDIIYAFDIAMKDVGNWFVDLCEFCQDSNKLISIRNKAGLDNAVEEFSKKLDKIETDHWHNKETHSSIKDYIWYMFECVAFEERLTHCPSYGVFTRLEIDILFLMLHIIKSKYSMQFLQNKWDNCKLLSNWVDICYFIVGIIYKQDYEMNLANLLGQSKNDDESKDNNDSININEAKTDETEEKDDLISIFSSNTCAALLCDNHNKTNAKLFQNVFDDEITNQLKKMEMENDAGAGVKADDLWKNKLITAADGTILHWLAYFASPKHFKMIMDAMYNVVPPRGKGKGTVKALIKVVDGNKKSIFDYIAARSDDTMLYGKYIKDFNVDMHLELESEMTLSILESIYQIWQFDMSWSQLRECGKENEKFRKILDTFLENNNNDDNDGNNGKDDESGTDKVIIDDTKALSRVADIKYDKNEVYINVIEYAHALIDSNGNRIHSYARGSIIVDAKLSGYPVCRFGVNDKESLEKRRRARGSMKRVLNKNAMKFNKNEMQFDRCVNLSRYNEDLTIIFVPPDKPFNVLHYRVDKIDIPLTMTSASISVGSGGDKNGNCLIYDIPLKSTLKYHKGENILVIIPVPAQISKDNIKNVELTQGEWKYKRYNSTIEWIIGEMKGGIQETFKAIIDLNDLKENLYDILQSYWQPLPLVQVRFDIPMYTVTGLKVRFFNVQDPKLLYKTIKWVKYLCKQGEYQFQLNLNTQNLK